jgi:hypothetical protein
MQASAEKERHDPTEGSIDPYLATKRPNTVSFILPVHRFLTSVLLFADERGLAMADALAKVHNSQQLRDCGLVLLDYPLRCIVCAAQARHNLWVRNGLSLLGQTLNYRGKLSHMMFDLDLVAV